jgi:hypothetical protein
MPSQSIKPIHFYQNRQGRLEKYQSKINYLQFKLSNFKCLIVFNFKILIRRTLKILTALISNKKIS